MDPLIVPDLDVLRHWLDQLGITFFECDSCQALHLPHMQNFDGVFDAKVDLIDNTILFTALAEVRPTALIALVGELSQINASTLGVKALVDIQDDNLPKFIACMSLNVSVGVSQAQFAAFMQQGEEQISMVMMEARANGMLFLGEGEEGEGEFSAESASGPVIH
ncbi:YbjN domain-containing protein [Edwardsiella ictaluri]|uniref:YbjN domain-containing protein n=1 Tax=Edwardsiella ictaluri TaxID=67780 RepID=UPI0037841458